MTKIDTQKMLDIRDEYIELIKREILGPGSEISYPDMEHELISDPPSQRYSMGILFPHGILIGADDNDSMRVEENDNIEEDDIYEDGKEVVDESSKAENEKEKKDTISDVTENLDEEVGLSTQNRPSSMGLTFFVDNDCNKINCKIKFALYRKSTALDCRIPFLVENPDRYNVPEEVSDWVKYERETGMVKLLQGGITHKKIGERREKTSLEGDDAEIYPILYKLSDQLNRGYVREPHELDVEINFDKKSYVDDNQKLDGTYIKVTGLKRKINDKYAITIMLVNDKERDLCIKKAKYCDEVYQSEIVISTENNNFSFVEYSDNVSLDLMDEEEKSLNLQYRNKKVYATGLGNSVNWSLDEDGNGVIKTEYFPIEEVPQMDFNLTSASEDTNKALSMKYLSDLNDISKEEKVSNLEEVISLYENWINSLKEKRSTLKKEYVSIAEKNIQNCENSLNRMKMGIDILKKNDLAWNSFQLANRAMLTQRAHIKMQEMFADKDRFDGDEELIEMMKKIDYRNVDQIIKDYYAWRPFQLAFILMSINSITNDECDERNIVDLIWFPTGGGKTEAYLGLTAFTIFYRRMAYSKKADGTTVIMRYTLRLLASQQFTRASTLICACEYIRRDSARQRSKYKKYDIGKEPITIGLWIGGSHIPNTNSEAKNHLSKLFKSTPATLKFNKNNHNKFQVLKCPWCGTKMVQELDGKKKLGDFGYRLRDNRHFELFCPQQDCSFHAKLPIQIIDEELYNNPPTLLFGTVDKFAMLPWKKECGNFFATRSNSRTPELIIQDELHLISGPLGTIVGLYETAIDAICKNKGVSPKIVASTATIRKAKEQCFALYNREVAQFPSPGLDAEDSFFAREAVIDYEKGKYGRKYVGLMSSGKTKAMMEDRTIAAIMQKIYTMDIEDYEKDKFWTLTTYFNSLKDLGKCSTLVDDDIRNYVRSTALRTGKPSDIRFIGIADELTSRVTTTELNETLDKLEKVEYSKENIANRKYASNILLATNMISVGIDVARLNIMLLVGQPKLTSEYIQASSRVGRSYPGIAMVMYDSSKSRDRSHYEQFKSYHESFYKYVEPTGATPFSKPARDRALNAVVISIIRHTINELSEEKNAGDFDITEYSEQLEEIKKFIIDRSRNVTKMLNPDMNDESNDILEEMDELFERWSDMIEEYHDKFYYGEKFMMKKPDEDVGRLIKNFNTDKDSNAFNVMTSMRNVDIAVPGQVIIWEEE